MVLRDVINTLGQYKRYATNAQGGHYIAYVKCGELWYQCDDSCVVEVDEATARSAQAYMLFYRQHAAAL